MELVQTGELGEAEYEDPVLVPAILIDRASWWIDNRDTEIRDLPELFADLGETAVRGL